MESPTTPDSVHEMLTNLHALWNNDPVDFDIDAIRRSTDAWAEWQAAHQTDDRHPEDDEEDLFGGWPTRSTTSFNAEAWIDVAVAMQLQLRLARWPQVHPEQRLQPIVPLLVGDDDGTDSDMPALTSPSEAEAQSEPETLTEIASMSPAVSSRSPSWSSHVSAVPSDICDSDAAVIGSSDASVDGRH